MSKAKCLSKPRGFTLIELLVVTFITHPVIWLTSTSYNAIDNSHGGNFRDGTNPDDWSDSIDNPIAMADGSVEIRLKSKMKQRASWQSNVFGETVVYY